MTFRVGLRIILAGALIAAGSTAYAQPSPENTLLDKARSLEGRGRPDLAAQIWQQILLVDPNQTEALAALARHAKQIGNLQESKVYLERLRKVNPSDPALQQIQSLPVLSQQQARLREAQRLAANQQFDQAMQVYREIFGDDPPPGALAIAYYETLGAIPGGWEGATAGLRKLTDKYPGSEDYRLSLGRLLTYRPATRLAGMKLLEAIKGSSDLTNKARQAWRQALVWEGTSPQVQPALRAYLTRYPDTELQKLLEGGAQQGSQPGTTRQTGLARTEIENQAFAALKANNVKEAETLFQKALKENSHSSGALAGLGFVRMKQENFSAAVDAFESAKAEAPQEDAITEALETARFYKVMKDASDAFSAGQFDAAIQQYRSALTIRPTSVVALQGLGGTLIRSGNPAEAAPVFEKITEQQPQNDDAWRQLVDARYRATGADSALATARLMPSTVQLMLAKNVEYLVLIANANCDVGEKAVSRKYLQQAVEIANAKGLEIGVPLQLQFAGLYLRHGYPVEAATVYQRAVDAQPENLDAWEGLLAALIQTHEEVRAAHAADQMPKGAYQSALKRPGFLRSLAAISTSLGKLDAAEKFLESSIALDAANDNTENVAAQLQLAHLRLTQGRPHQAESVLRIMANAHPDNPDVWKALVSALHQQQMDEDALKEDGHEPPAVKAMLQNDPDYMSSLAACESAVGQQDEALRIARRALALMQQRKRVVPADLQIQVAWLVLNTEGDERELYGLLESAGKRHDLTQTQEKGVAEIWSVWSIRRATKAIKTGDMDHGIAILEAARKLLPKDLSIQRMLGGVLLQAGKPEQALAVYKSWGMKGATTQDYIGAIGAAQGAGDATAASVWLQNALNRWPKDPRILVMAGKQAAQTHDYKRAENYWKRALVGLPAGSEPTPVAGSLADLAPAPAEEQSPVKAIGDLLVGPDAIREAPAATATQMMPALPAQTTDRAAPSVENQPRIGVPPAATPAARKAAPASKSTAQPPPADQHLKSSGIASPVAQNRSSGVAPKASPYVLVSQTTASPGQVLPRIGESLPDPGRDSSTATAAPANEAPASSEVSTPDPDTVIPQQPAKGATLRDEIQDELDSIDARNSGFLDTGTTVTGRSGENGFDRLIVERAELEASYVIGNAVRVAVIAEPTFLDAGTPTGLSTRRFGLLPSGGTFADQSVGGVGGEVQVSTDDLGFRVGVTPDEFLVRNFTGGFRFRPGHGPITLLAERDNLRDSLLSYAGARDPVTNRIWGGVVANTFSAVGNWGGAKSGFYGSFGFQTITGTNVESNNRLDGNVGMYWRIMDQKDSSLTVGFNLSAMHYEYNLSGFTLGQGGYFSPQQYFLTSIPIQWRGVYKTRVQYLLNGALGVQHFEEDSSPFFPTMPAIQGLNGPYTASQSVTGANYSVDFRAALQLTPRWYAGIWANVNNTRNYTAETLALYLRYTFAHRPLTQNSAMPSIPDWKGVEPFRLP